ncbi:phage holin family protein [Candidatus Microgenomates bacterium]|nr:phage holin family protein [Candidatus Microgenomates bacterium]
MQSIIKKLTIVSFSLWLTSQIAQGLVINDGIITLIVAGFVLYLLERVLKPILQLVTLPISIATFGLFSLVINAVNLYVLTLLITNVKIVPFVFPGFSFAGFIIPALNFNQLGAFLAVAISLTVIKKVIKWITS